MSNSDDIGLSDLFSTPPGTNSGNDEQAGGVSGHSSIRSIGSRMRAVGRVLLSSDTCLELFTSWGIFLGYTLYWVLIRSAALLYLVSDCPACGPFDRPACRYPAPLGSNKKWRPLMLCAKLGTVSSLAYLLFLITNIIQLEVIGRYKISTSCVLSLTNCQNNFLISDETQHISRDELALINSILRTKNLEIKEGDLKTIVEKVILPIDNMTNLVSAKSGEGTSFGPTTAKLIGKDDNVDEKMLDGKEIIYKIDTPGISNQKAGLASDAKTDPEKEISVKASGRHGGLPQLVQHPHWAGGRASAGTQPPRLLAATAGENTISFSLLQATAVDTSEPATVYWRPWISVVTERPHSSSTERPTYSSTERPKYSSTERPNSWPRIRDVVLTTVTPILQSSIPDFHYQTTKSSSRFVAFTPMRIVRKRGSRITLQKQAARGMSSEIDQQTLSDPMPNQLERPPRT